MEFKPISKWELFLLKFKLATVAIDISDEDYPVKLYYKFMFGKLYVVKVKRIQDADKPKAEETK